MLAGYICSDSTLYYVVLDSRTMIRVVVVVIEDATHDLY